MASGVVVIVMANLMTRRFLFFSIGCLILREDADNHLFELRREALAHTIFQWMTGIEQELMEVRQTIENRFKEFQQSGGSWHTSPETAS